ncbi:MAG: hypothetical protein ACRDRJ_32115 [Streptosporangiaceae bacterium]
MMDTSPPSDHEPPPGTAIVRPLRHVRAVRERYLQRFSDPARAAASRSARAWAWALGETTTAPVTGEPTATPPTRRDIQAEIAIADGRRLRDEQHDRADAAATILRWLIGDDDHVPVRTDFPGELVGGFGPVVRSHAQIAATLSLSTRAHQRAAVRDHDLDADPESSRLARHDADYLGGVTATLAWILGERTEAPISRQQAHELTTRNLKRERLSADDVIEQARYPWMVERLPPPWYGAAVKLTISWLLGDTTTPPVDTAVRGPCDPQSGLPAMPRDTQAGAT